MFNVPYLSLILWFPVVYLVFERMPVPKAIVFSFVSAWLFLPPIAIQLPGIPDWGKMTATVVSVLICTGMKRPDAYQRIKASWLDLPVAAYCLCPFASAISASTGPYDGASAVLEEVFRWGFPYLIGRAFLGDPAGNRLLCLGIAMGGVAYLPICLFELQVGPILKKTIYGINDNATVFDKRYGGYRPMGFLQTGLELGWWMCCATFSAFLLWKSGSVKRVKSYPMGAVTLALAVVTVACKSTGAILQLAIGFGTIYLGRMTKRSVVLLPILLIPPAYCIARTTGVWTGENLVHYAGRYFGADRAQSLGYRFEQEEGLMVFTRQRPILGWARNGGFNAPNKFGAILITDGLWIIVFGTMGAVGLASLILMLNLPAAAFAWKYKTEDWFHPDVAPVTALVVLLPLFMIDNLSNAMLNPIYAIAMGSASGFLATRSAKQLGAGKARDQARTHAAVGQDARGAIEWRDYEEAITRLDDQLDELHRSFRRYPTADLLIQIGRAHASRARCYQRLGDVERSIEEREYLEGLWGQYARLLGGPPLDHPEHADNLNDLAWALLIARPRDPSAVERSIGYAARLVEAHPTVGAYWNTLGVGRYRKGEYLAAVQALSRSINLSPAHGSPYDFYYLALANHRLGYRRPAEAWMGRAEGAVHPEILEEDFVLESLRNEAAAELFARTA